MSTSYNTHSTGRYSARMRRFALLQAALQVSVALTPAWAITAVAQQTPAPSELHDYLNPAAQLAQSGNVEGFAAQQASGMASQQLQQWLQNFGTARVEFGINSKFAPQTSSVDLLFPLYDSPERLFFTQNGIRLSDGQATGNFGLGQRHFIDDWMVGYNAFYDENFSLGHKRFGIGLETWRDYLKLSANGYVRISDWKNADNVTDYQARPANGFDLRAEGWLADYPSLSARLMYEQYYGSEVALFGKDKRQKNPMAVTAGLSWTPVPMFSLSADHKAGGNQNESLFGLQMNWQFGRSLESQLDPDQVNLGATLAGNGMDLVNRNNNIVLEYRKQELTRLSLYAIEGAGMAIKQIDYQHDSKYGLKEIIWNDAAIVAAGGKVIDEGNGRYALTLPPFKPGEGNSYTLSGVAVDPRGNRSAAATTTIMVGRTDVNVVNSRVTADNSTLVADGKSTTLIGIFLVDADNLPIEGALKRLKVFVREDALPETGKASTAQSTASPGGNKSASVGDITEKGKGLYEVILTMGTRSSLAVITASFDDVVLPLASVKQIADVGSLTPGNSTLESNVTRIIADGNDKAVITFTLRDINKNPVAGQSVSFRSSQPDSFINNTVDKGNGTYTAEITGLQVGETTVTVLVNGANFDVASAKVTLTPGAGDISKSTLAVTPASIMANGVAESTLTLTLKDGNSHPIDNVNVTFHTGLTGTSIGTVTNEKGVYSAKLKGTTEGQATISVKIDNADFAVQNRTVTLTADDGATWPEYEFSGNMYFTEAILKAALATTDRLRIRTSNSQRAEFIDLPPASGQAGKRIRIDRNSASMVLLRYDGQRYSMRNSERIIMTSNGSNWVKSGLP